MKVIIPSCFALPVWKEDIHKAIYKAAKVSFFK